MSIRGVDSRLWGKQAGLDRPYPLVCHLLDTGAIAGALWDVWWHGAAAARASTETGLPARELRQLVCFWAGLHDMGKISPPFQVKVPELHRQLLDGGGRYGPDVVSDEARRLHHSEATHWILPEILAGLGYPAGGSARRHIGHQVAQMLGGHHGKFWESMRREALVSPRGHCPALGVETGWVEQCRAHVDVLQHLTGAGALTSPLSPALAVVISGVVVVADWLASQEEFIAARLPQTQWSGDVDELCAHWKQSVHDAPDVVREAGLGRALVTPARDFVERYGFEPNALQASLARELPHLVSQGKGTGLLLVTAPAGDGKTEAALEAAAVLAGFSGATGIGFSLPTMATADAMYKRVEAFARQALQGDAALTRVHSMAWLAKSAGGDAASQSSEAGKVLSGQTASVEAAQWLHGGRRGLLAPLSVFTIDQGLSAVLPLRYNALRMLALSGKVLVVDEAHAYGPWMHALLVRLLEWLGALGAPVVMLSATLTGRVARSLMAAYVRGSGADAGDGPGAEMPQLHYPGWVWVDAGGEVSPPRAVRSEREHLLRFQVEPVRRDTEVTHTRHRLSVIKRLLGPVVDEGGCVLICCTTVAEAQRTWHFIAEWFDELAPQDRELPELFLLHSRFRAGDRAVLTKRCEGTFGKQGRRPVTGAVMVATQIVEQSLDLDFDLVISELAPVAQLIQRAGRCQRHRLQPDVPDPHRDVRPAWLSQSSVPPTVEVVVLDPVGSDGVFDRPREWGAVYDEGLLLRTSELLAALAVRPQEVPAGVQGLVDAVYAEDFTSVAAMDETVQRRLALADAERLAEEAAEEQLAAMVRIPSPGDLGKDLHPLSATSVPVDESLIATRLGADSARLVCAYEQPDKGWTLDEAGELPIPGIAGGTADSRYQARLVADCVIPVPGSWVRGCAELLPQPQAWTDNAVLRSWALMPMRRGSDGSWRGLLRPGEVSYGTCGLAPYAEFGDGRVGAASAESAEGARS
ncbi:CRISPR-associated helicase Cas3' [Streptomyces albidus (ex Kaewkla and Franco 2022)]|uniref:CRISPR-associated helicase Cas3' n=1 Tax=Streptomyces albidus (ex Kaewkla and Franco 2022) TaxID=722709 RepID=UPI0015EEEA5F|nr:CRISPR-associated helicase Cas3' [Streptomyces albidus (ex Kaewkla and Franco 2022)]